VYYSWVPTKKKTLSFFSFNQEVYLFWLCSGVRDWKFNRGAARSGTKIIILFEISNRKWIKTELWVKIQCGEIATLVEVERRCRKVRFEVISPALLRRTNHVYRYMAQSKIPRRYIDRLLSLSRAKSRSENLGRSLDLDSCLGSVIRFSRYDARYSYINFISPISSEKSRSRITWWMNSWKLGVTLSNWFH